MSFLRLATAFSDKFYFYSHAKRGEESKQIPVEVCVDSPFVYFLLRINLTMEKYCRLCVKTDRETYIPIVGSNPLNIKEKLKKLLNIQVRIDLFGRNNIFNIQINISGC